jgi:rhamnose utilization protein RhaD (predicted bifunctional aldolase and dehydrogenase)
MKDNAEQRSGNLLKEFCSKVGKDPLLVQGAGGNASWKDNKILWIKASGTWLADAQKKDIFVPVDLMHLQQEVSKNNFKAIPRVIVDSNMKPSIETLLHALMPHKYVVHLHAIEILTYLVRLSPKIELINLLKNFISWSYVEYFKPGEELARAVSNSLDNKETTDVVFLKNHGVVIGGSSVLNIEETLKKLIKLLDNKNNNTKYIKTKKIENLASLLKINNYTLSRDTNINQLAINQDFSKRLIKEWALYPDHVVFLGDRPFVCSHPLNENDIENINLFQPQFIFVIGVGVLESIRVTISQQAQLRCYFDVIVRQPPEECLDTLSNEAINELVDWDAEKFRLSQSL